MSSVRFDDYAKSIDNFYRQNTYQNFYQPVLYYVKAGDTLSQIITNYYDIRFGTKEYELAVRHLLFSNPHIKSANAIQPKQVINLTPMNPSYGPVCTEEEARAIEEAADQAAAMEKYRAWSKQPTSTLTGFVPSDSATQHFMSKIPSDPEEREVFRTLAWLQANTDFLTVGSAVTTTLGGLASKQNNSLVREMELLQSQHKKGMSKVNYDLKAEQLARRYSHEVGPLFERLVFKGQSAKQVARINSTKAFPAKSDFLKYTDRLSLLSKLSSNGGIVLAGVGVLNGTYDMCQAKTTHEKNNILMKTIGGTAGGVLAGIGATLLLASNPLGWVGAIIIGATAAYASHAAADGLKYLYNLSGDPVDFVSMTGVESVCNLNLFNPEKGFEKLKTL